MEAFSTPRRLVLRADCSWRQADREEKVWGPSLKVARDAAGDWTGAAQGFARKSGVAPRSFSRAPRIRPRRTTPSVRAQEDGRAARGRRAARVLAALLRALAFPKRMSWDAWLEDGKGAFPFGRPIRWLVALLGGHSYGRAQVRSWAYGLARVACLRRAGRSEESSELRGRNRRLPALFDYALDESGRARNHRGCARREAEVDRVPVVDALLAPEIAIPARSNKPTPTLYIYARAVVGLFRANAIRP